MLEIILHFLHHHGREWRDRVPEGLTTYISSRPWNVESPRQRREIRAGSVSKASLQVKRNPQPFSDGNKVYKESSAKGFGEFETKRGSVESIGYNSGGFFCGAWEARQLSGKTV